MKNLIRLPTASLVSTVILLTTLSETSLVFPPRAPSQCICVQAFVVSQSSYNSQSVVARKSFRLFSQEQGDENDSAIFVSSERIIEKSLLLTVNNNTTASSARFGDVIPLKRPSPAESVPLSQGRIDPSGREASASSFTFSATTALDPTQMKGRNFGVALLSIGLAVMNYVWQYLHPLQPIQLLYQMEQQSSPITVIGTTNKPTVVDFWAPWYVHKQDRCLGVD